MSLAFLVEICKKTKKKWHISALIRESKVPNRARNKIVMEPFGSGMEEKAEVGEGERMK